MTIPETCESCAYGADPNASGVLLKTKYWRLVLARDQAYLGRSYLVLRDHKGSLSELTEEEWQDYQSLVRRIESSYETAFDSGRPFNWACLMNNAFQEQPAHPHVHWHVWPRHEAPIIVGSTTFTDPEYAHHHDFDRQQRIDDETFELIFQRLQAALQTE